MFSSFSRFLFHFRYSATVAVIPLASSFLASTPVGAQTVPAPATPAVKPPVLRDALLRVAWRGEQGVLLTLSPFDPLPTPPPTFNTDGGLPPENNDAGDDQNVAPVTSAEAAEMARVLQATPPGSDRSALRLAVVARVWQKRVLVFGGVTTVAPSTMTVLTARPGAPDLFAHLNRAELSRYLFATFSAAQWRLLASHNGIGRGDLENEQAELFDKMLPDPFTYTRATTHYLGRTNDPAQTRTLTGGERQSVRLRVKLQTGVGAPLIAKNAEGRFFPVLFNGNRDGGIFGVKSQATPFLDLVGDKQYQGSAALYGVALSEEKRNKLKPADLDFATVSGAVSLLPPSPAPAAATTGAAVVPRAPVLTVADLLPRLREATGLDLYADARLAKLRVWTRGADTAQAGEILQALCVSVGGTIRKVEAPGDTPVYILTSDLEGIAARISVVDDWQSRAYARENQLKASYLQTVRNINPLPFLEFDENEPVKLPSPLLGRVARSGGVAGGGRRGNLTVTPSELTPTQQAYLGEQVTRSATDTNFAVSGDRYEISVSLWLGIVVPGAGEITDSPLQSVSDIFLEASAPAPLPSAQGASLWARVPGTGEDAARTAAREIVDIAASHKMQAVYLDGATPAALRAAIEQAQKPAGKGVAVWGVLRPLQAPPGENGALADRNARGQTSVEYEEERAGQAKTPLLATATAPTNWRIVAREETLQAAQKRASEMATVPGLAGVLVADPLPPGYRGGTQNGVNPGDGDTDFRAAAARQVGWTLEQRVQFIRKCSADPADIVPYFAYGPVDIPYFPDSGHNDGGLADTWSKWRAERGQTFLTQLRQSLETARPGLPVQVCGQVNENPLSQTTAIAWLADWFPGVGGNLRLYWNYPEQTTPLPSQARQGVTVAALSASVKPIKPRVLLRVPPQSAQAAILRGGPGWDGAVFDFSNLSFGPGTTARIKALLDETP